MYLYKNTTVEKLLQLKTRYGEKSYRVLFVKRIKRIKIHFNGCLDFSFRIRRVRNCIIRRIEGSNPGALSRFAKESEYEIVTFRFLRVYQVESAFTPIRQSRANFIRCLNCFRRITVAKFSKILVSVGFGSFYC